jgi:hypothetical protein
MDERILSTTETAERLQVDRRTINWIESGLFPKVYRMSPLPCSPYQIPESDIIEFEKKRDPKKR